jgi:hypothetical protein
MSILISITQHLNKKKKKKSDKFTNGTTSAGTTSAGTTTTTAIDTKKEKDIKLLTDIINMIFFVGAMVLFFKCKNLKGKFNFLEFCAALCYSPIYVIYRLIFVKVNEENCLPEEARKIREFKRLQELIKEK